MAMQRRAQENSSKKTNLEIYDGVTIYEMSERTLSVLSSVYCLEMGWKMWVDREVFKVGFLWEKTR